MKRILRSPWLITPLFLGLLIALWHFYVTHNDVSSFILPRPGAVFDALREVMSKGRTYHHAWVTTQEILLGFVIGVGFGVIVGLLLAKAPVIERSLNPLIVAAQVAPKTPLVPLLIVWFGYGATPKVLIAALLAFFPVFRNTLLGLKSIPAGFRDVSVIAQMSRRQRFLHMEMPYASPYILTSMEMAMVLSVIGVIVGEFLAGNEGLGYLVVQAMNNLDVDTLFAYLILLTLLGYLLHLAVSVLKQRAIPWHESEQMNEVSA
ncbi:MAG: ABC transporter permease [Acidimicrobiia bacterium]